ncbi:hypothetical protein PAXRUDRAFT_827869 [Paxillus rubicundulus Ve08.2h10]|uniref:Unplaced genomic scaffold scaffold_276, whole genome shotgun sequence n=1 Tax=Paxillus rubicundulus Ve08.2h10 TaxID=930991 RepID=A0A0D0DBK0_9AGAM|nr:hypothetical protein PAXRUDRAFT_827869 [Paxillus rubicundulus Ve08.2h10]
MEQGGSLRWNGGLRGMLPLEESSQFLSRRLGDLPNDVEVRDGTSSDRTNQGRT